MSRLTLLGDKAMTTRDTARIVVTTKPGYIDPGKYRVVEVTPTNRCPINTLPEPGTNLSTDTLQKLVDERTPGGYALYKVIIREGR